MNPQENLLRKDRWLVFEVGYFVLLWSQNSTTITDTTFYTSSKMLGKPILTATKWMWMTFDSEEQMNIAQWFIVCRAWDLASVHSIDVSLSKVLHHYLLQGQSLLGYHAHDLARSCSGHLWELYSSCCIAMIIAELLHNPSYQNH